MIIYQIAGRNSGPAEKYDAVEKALTDARRCSVVRPRALASDEKGRAYQAIVTLVEDADALVTTEGWESNKTAVLEVAVARATGIPVASLEETIR